MSTTDGLTSIEMAMSTRSSRGRGGPRVHGGRAAIVVRARHHDGRSAAPARGDRTAGRRRASTADSPPPTRISTATATTRARRWTRRRPRTSRVNRDADPSPRRCSPRRSRFAPGVRASTPPPPRGADRPLGASCLGGRGREVRRGRRRWKATRRGPRAGRGAFRPLRARGSAARSGMLGCRRSALVGRGRRRVSPLDRCGPAPTKGLALDALSAHARVEHAMGSQVEEPRRDSRSSTLLRRSSIRERPPPYAGTAQQNARRRSRTEHVVRAVRSRGLGDPPELSCTSKRLSPLRRGARSARHRRATTPTSGVGVRARGAARVRIATTARARDAAGGAAFIGGGRASVGSSRLDRRGSPARSRLYASFGQGARPRRQAAPESPRGRGLAPARRHRRGSSAPRRAAEPGSGGGRSPGRDPVGIARKDAIDRPPRPSTWVAALASHGRHRHGRRARSCAYRAIQAQASSCWTRNGWSRLGPINVEPGSDGCAPSAAGTRTARPRPRRELPVALRSAPRVASAEVRRAVLAACIAESARPLARRSASITDRTVASRGPDLMGATSGERARWPLTGRGAAARGGGVPSTVVVSHGGARARATAARLARKLAAPPDRGRGASVRGDRRGGARISPADGGGCRRSAARTCTAPPRRAAPAAAGAPRLPFTVGAGSAERRRRSVWRLLLHLRRRRRGYASRRALAALGSGAADGRASSSIDLRARRLAATRPAAVAAALEARACARVAASARRSAAPPPTRAVCASRRPAPPRRRRSFRAR